MSTPKLLPGKFVWFELVSGDPKKAQAFYSDVLGWRTVSFPMADSTYEMAYAGETMLGGYARPKSEGERAYWISYVSIEDLDAAAKAASANGGKVIEAPFDVGVGRAARISDPQGAELYLFRKAAGDPADSQPPPGGWLWNELHTTDPASAIRFYERVVGFSSRAMDMGPNGTYYILSQGGVDRGGVTQHLPSGMPPHWLPYVFVDDVDAAVARARKLNATIPFGPEDIHGVGRFAVLEDPTGGNLAVMKPIPMEKELTESLERAKGRS